MAQIGLDPNPLGVSSVDTEGTYAGGPVSYHGVPLMVHRKFIGDASPKVVRLADIYRIPSATKPGGLAENVDAWDGVEHRPDVIQIERIFGSARADDVSMSAVPFKPPPIQFQEAIGLTLEEMRRNLDPDFVRLGDARLMWVNEGTFWIQQLERYPKTRSIDSMTVDELRAEVRKLRGGVA